MTSADPIRHPASPMTGSDDGYRGRWIVPAAAPAWDDPVISEWELTAAGWEDHHPHTESVVVLEGELHVESGGREVVLGPGDAAVVPAGHVGRYWAPTYARMISVYGPNPTGVLTPEGRLWLLADAGGSSGGS